MTRRSSLVVGSVGHRRRRPTTNAFRYRTYHALLDVDELDALDVELRGFGLDRPAPVGFRTTDHLGPTDLAPREKLRRWLDHQQVALPAGPVLLLTNLRVLGHVFDPVSWWFCHHPDDSLAFVVAEVNNTFGDAHCYLLDELVERDGLLRARTAKRLHVSPFLPVDGLQYDFAFQLGEDRVLAHVEVSDDEGVVVDATQSGRRVPLTTRTLWRTVVRNPLLPLRTVLLIHWQAIRLATKRVRFHRRPAASDDGYERPTAPSPDVSSPNPYEHLEEHAS